VSRLALLHLLDSLHVGWLGLRDALKKLALFTWASTEQQCLAFSDSGAALHWSVPTASSVR
jgi:hypothetical protein